MKLRVDDITAEARQLIFGEPEAEINRALGAGPPREYRVERPVDVELSYYRAGTEIFLEGEVMAAAAAGCARCAEEFPTVRRRRFRYVLAPRAIGVDDGGVRADDLEFTLYEGDAVDLTPLVREQVLLALAERPLCREDCRGLCPRCGANLNEAPCGCRTETVDPRLAVLRTLKIQRAGNN